MNCRERVNGVSCVFRFNYSDYDRKMCITLQTAHRDNAFLNHVTSVFRLGSALGLEIDKLSIRRGSFTKLI